MKKQRISLFILALSLINVLFCLSLSAQVIKGRVTDMQGEAISYASIFVKELAMGTTTNEQGVFEIKAPEGKYTCSFQHISYQSNTTTVQVPMDKELVIKLEDRIYDLPSVTIGNKQEDPAYDMVRKAIGMAPYYMNQLNAYNANVYIKGTMVIQKISGLVKAMAGKEIKEMKLEEGAKYLQESVSEIDYNSGKFHQKVKSISNTFPEGMDVELGLANYNIYSPDNRGMISPISPEAFSYYTFKYEGFSEEGIYIVNRIKVTPKRKSNMTFSGYIYLSEGYWNVHRFELSSEMSGMFSITYTNRQIYGELENNVWMPVSNSIDAAVSAMGNKAISTYASSIKYTNYKVNPQSLGKFTPTAKPQAVAVTQQPSQKSEELGKEIEKLLNKSEMSNRDAYKISRLMQRKEKEDRKNLPDSLYQKPTLDLTDNYKFEVDSTAKKRDSIYWETTRPIPLMTDEIQSYKRRDSLKVEKEKSDSIKKQPKNKIWNATSNILFGETFKIDSTFRITYSGLIDPMLLGFNAVDGWTYRQYLRASKRFKDTTTLYFGVEGEYAFSRKRFMLSGNINYTYLPEKRATISIDGGVKSADFNANGLGRFDNMVSSLFFHKNYINFYESRHISINHSMEVINGLTTNVGVGYQDRRRLENTTDYSFFYRDSREYRPNSPVQNPYVAVDQSLLDNHKAAILQLSATFTPEQYYRRYGRYKFNARSRFPTFTLLWRKGIEGVFGSQSNFDQLQLSAQQSIRLGAMTNFKYTVTGGWFPNNNTMHFRDFKQFGIKEFELLFSSWEENYNLLPSYMPATNQWYATAFAQYASPYLLLKYLPLLDRTMLQENLYLSYLTTPYLKNYTEIGYGLTNIWAFGSIGVFAGFKGVDYYDWGFKVSFNLSSFQ